MRIKTLHLEEFRGFKKQDFEFHPQFNLLIGENAAGKTSLLEGLERAAASFFLGIGGQGSSAIDKNYDVRRVPIPQGDTIPIEPQFPVVVRATGEVLGNNITWERTLQSMGGDTTRQKANSIKGIAENAAKMVQKGDKVLLPLFSHYGAGRLWVQPRDMRGDPQDDEKLPESRLDGYLFSNDPRIDMAGLFRWLKHERYVALEKGKDRFGFLAAKRAMKSCLPGCLSLEYSTAEKTVVVELEGKGSLPFHLLSDGQRIMLALVADIAFKASQLNPHLEDRILEETPGVVLVDELDLHLHPRWQRHVVADLIKTFPAIQFFATTHSAQIIGETPPDRIILLRRDGSWTRPNQTVGLDTNEVLIDIMHADTINQVVAGKLAQLDKLLADGEFTQARENVESLRNSYGDLARLAGAEAYMARMEILADQPEAKE